MKKLFVFAIVLIGFVFSATAQRGNGKATGSVKNMQQKELQSASIMLLRAKDSSTVKFAVADKAGNYEFNGIAPGKYIVSITSVGYSKAFSPSFEITETKVNVSLEAMTMIEAAKGLSGVTVTAKKPFVEQKIDRMVV